jgi:hypothetical protein
MALIAMSVKLLTWPEGRNQTNKIDVTDCI